MGSGDSDLKKLDYSGAFLDPKIEDEYRLANWGEFSRQWRVHLTIATSIYVAASITDYLTLGLTAQGVVSVGGRLLVFLIVLLIGYLTLKTKRREVFEFLTFGVELLLIVHTLLSAVVKADSLVYHLPPVILLITAFYVFIPNRLSLTILAGAIMSAGFLAVAITVFDASTRGIISFSLLLFAINLLGVFEVQRTNRLRREEFQKEGELREEIAKRMATEANLEIEVASRTKELESAKERLNDVVEILSDWVWELGPDLDITYVSKRFFDSHGIDGDTLIGQRHWSLISEDWIAKNPKLWEQQRERIRSHQSFSGFECEGIDGSGNTFVFQVSGKAHFDAQGNFLGYRGAGTDITKQKQAELKSKESEERFKWILDNSPVGLGISRIEDGKILYGNSILAKIYGLEKEELVGYQSKNVWRNPEDRDKFLEIYREHGQVIQQEAEGQRVDGTLFWCLVSWHPFAFNDTDCILFWLVDINDLKKTETKLTTAKLEAERANAAKSEFIAKISHELRTPLNSIIGLSEMLYDEATGANDLDYIEPLRRVNGAGQHLSSIINDILDLSKIEAGKMEIVWEDVALPSLVDQIHSTISPLAEKKNNRLDFEVSEACNSLVSDPVRLRQILLNLLGNANKFTENGTVSLEVSYQETDDVGRTVFVIRDTGIGIPQDEAGDLFKEFSQVRSSIKESRAGTGLGLAISKRIVEMMGGDIGFESTEGSGSTFWFDLPVRQDIAETKDG